MADARSLYRRLPGRGLRRVGPIAFLGTACRLYLGPDHLLCIDSIGYAEEYRRFYYTDIQATVLRRTGRGRAWSVGLGVATLICVMIALGLTGAAAVTFWIFGALFSVLLLVNAARGPTCVAHLQTAVHVEEMPSLTRLRVARRAMAALQERVDAAQGVLEPEAVASELAGAGEAALGQPALATPGRAARLRPTPGVRSDYKGGWHWALFSLFLLDAVQTLFVLFVRHPFLVLISSVLMGVLGICTIVALIRQQGSALHRLAKGVTWAALGYLGLAFVFGNVLLIVISAKEPAVASDQWRFLELLAEMDPFATPWYLALLLVSFTISAGLGVLGMLALKAGDGAPTETGRSIPPGVPLADSDLPIHPGSPGV